MRPNKNNRAARRKRAYNDITFFIDVLLKRTTYRGGRKAARASIRLSHGPSSPVFE